MKTPSQVGLPSRRDFLRLGAIAFGVFGGEGFLPHLIAGIGDPASTKAEDHTTGIAYIDLSMLVAEGYPTNWPAGFPRYRLVRTQVIGSESAYNIDRLTIDGNTGTQLDAPAHSVARPELKLPYSGPTGGEFTDVIPVWKFVGEACVVDVRDLLDQAANGVSPLIRKERLLAWEKAHRAFGPGDIPLFHSGYDDRYYRAMPEGRRLLIDPLERKAPGWPAPLPETTRFLAAARGVRHIGCDSPTMGPASELAEQTHYAAMQYGAIFTEGVMGLGKIPTTGAFYCMLGPKHAGGPYSEGRAFAITGDPLAGQLIESARGRRVIDLSVTNSIDNPITWPGWSIEQQRELYTKNDFLWSNRLQLYHHGHSMDSQAGTHLVPPAYALPAGPFDPGRYSSKVRGWLEEYQERYGARGISGMTTEKVPLAQTCGWSRVVNVEGLLGTTDRGRWPASPEITVALLREDEARHGGFRPGEIVIFRTGHTDRTFRPFAAGRACMTGPLAGDSEGWPALGADAVVYLAGKGILCVATDAPSLGGVNEKAALMTYWALGSHEMAGIEFLTNLSALPARAFFIFAPVKLADCHGGPGRAIALY